MTREEFQKRYGYDANSRLGNGAFGSVFKAWDDVKNCHVALKIQAVNPKMPDIRLKKEVEIASKLNHPNVAHYDTCYTFEDLNGESDVAVMSYYEHGSLDNLLRNVDLTMEQREDILVQILDGIAYLHYNGIIHRDLKPQNILILHLKGRYIPKITDFGISKQIVQGENSAISTSLYGGTYSYVSPEQLKETTIRKNTDLWSFGIIAFQLLTGTYPFNCGSFSPTSQDGRQEQFRQMTSGVLPQEINHIPEPWQTLIRQCLVVDNNERIAHGPSRNLNNGACLVFRILSRKLLAAYKRVNNARSESNYPFHALSAAPRSSILDIAKFLTDSMGAAIKRSIA
jgi:serine/threonine protein kinase